jgi:hypothetical protein
MSTFTTAKNLEQVARGADVGTWDTPTNSNWGIVDAALGQSVTIGLNNSNVTLSAAQYQCQSIIFNSTLTGGVVVTFPTSFTGPYTIKNLCSGTSAFQIQLGTTAAGGQVIACPPGTSFDCLNDGTNFTFRNFGIVGSYVDYAGPAMPAWTGNCTVSPYLNCDGTTFSSATYPQLATILGGNTLPDSRGRARFTLNQTTARIQSSVTGLDGNTLAAGGGSQFLHSHNHGTTDLGHTHTVQTAAMNGYIFGGGTHDWGATGNKQDRGIAGPDVTNTTNVTNITINNSSYGGASQNIPPAYIGGITMIRAG